MRLLARWKKFRALGHVLGLRAAIEYCVRWKCGRLFGQNSDYWVQPSQTAHPVSVRLGSSDFDVFNQIFAECEYGCLDDMKDVGLTIDCGANVGFSSAYFLSQFPRCQVVAIEPDPANFAALQRNLAVYGSRVKLIRAGVWSGTAPLVLCQQKYRDGREWSRQVRLCGTEREANVEGVSVGSLLAASGHERISLLKVDIEGAEAVVFTESCRAWLGRVDAIAIELHDDSVLGNASQVFFSAIDGQGFDISRSGELTICRRTKPMVPSNE